MRRSLLALAPFALASCSVDKTPPNPAVAVRWQHRPDATDWFGDRPLKVGTVVRVLPGQGDIARVSVLTSELGSRITTTRSDPYSDHTTIDDTAGLSATLDTIAKFLPSAKASFASSTHIERDAKQVTGEAGPERIDFLNAIFAVDRHPDTDGLRSLFETLRSQNMADPAPPKGALYIITEVQKSPDITWITKKDNGDHAGMKVSVKAASAEFKGDMTFNGSNEAHYTGTPAVISVIMRRIGRDGTVVRFDDGTQGPKGIVG